MFFHMEKEKRRERCRNLMELCNLSRDYYTRLPSELSGGEQKRVAIARALAAEPQCLIFDEATNGFDLPLRKKIIDEIIDLQQQLGFTLIFITHDMELAVVVADEILSCEILIWWSAPRSPVIILYFTIHTAGCSWRQAV